MRVCRFPILIGVVLLASWGAYLIFAFCNWQAGVAAPVLYYVAPQGDCGAAAPCFGSLQEAVTAAQAGDEIRVAEGVYTDVQAGPSVTALAAIDKPLSIHGGYDPDDWESADPAVHPTILDAHQAGRVLSVSPGADLVIDGFTLQNGLGYNLYVESAMLTMSNCQVLSATLLASGQDSGAVYLLGTSNSSISQVVIAGNAPHGLMIKNNFQLLLDTVTIKSNGKHGLFSDQGNTAAVVKNSHFAGNARFGMYWDYPSTDIQLLSNQVASNQQGGLMLYYGMTNAIVAGNTITGNVGDGISIDFGIDNSLLTGNTIAGNSGLGVDIQRSANVALDNNIIVNNQQGGVSVSTAWWGVPAQAELRHNTLSGNDLFGVRVGEQGIAWLTNTVITDHPAGLLGIHPSAIAYANNTLWFANDQDTALAGGGTIHTDNNLSGDPLFAGGSDPFAAYHLAQGSAAIDRGLPTALNQDIDGQPRSLPDLGADEFDYSITFAPDHQRSVPPGSSQVYTHTLTNSGALPLSLALSAQSNRGWPFTLEPVNLVLDSGEIALVTYTLDIPADALGQVDTSLVTVTSQAPAAAWAAAKNISLVGLGVSLEPDFDLDIAPGETITLAHTLKNTGSFAFAYTLQLHSELGWGTLLDPGPVQLDPGESKAVIIRWQAPITASHTLNEKASLMVTSPLAQEVLAQAATHLHVLATPGTRHVSLAGSDNQNNCSQPAFPCLSLQQAVNEAVSGDQVKIATGHYTDTATLQRGALAAVDKTITILGGFAPGNWGTPSNDPSLTTLDGDQAGRVIYAGTPGITLTLQTLTLQNGLDKSVDILDSRLVMTNCQVLGTVAQSPGWDMGGISLVSSHHSAILDSYIADNLRNGIYMKNSQQVTIEGNTIEHNQNAGLLSREGNHQAQVSNNLFVGNNGYGLYWDYPSSDIRLEGNHITGNKKHGVWLYFRMTNAVVAGNYILDNLWTGLRLDYENIGLQITGNTIASNTGPGVEIHRSFNNTLENNIIANNQGGGLLIQDKWFENKAQASLLHNTFAGNTGYGISVGAGATLALTNTIIFSQSIGVQTTAADAILAADTTLWFANAEDTEPITGSLTTTNNRTGNPLFKGGLEPFQAYHLQPGSAAINMARVSELFLDIDGQARPANGIPDIGADELEVYPVYLPVIRR